MALGSGHRPEHSWAAPSQDLISTKTLSQLELGRGRLTGETSAGGGAQGLRGSPGCLQGPPCLQEPSPALLPRLTSAPVSLSRELQEGCSSWRVVSGQLLPGKPSLSPGKSLRMQEAPQRTLPVPPAPEVTVVSPFSLANPSISDPLSDPLPFNFGDLARIGASLPVGKGAFSWPCCPIPRSPGVPLTPCQPSAHPPTLSPTPSCSHLPLPSFDWHSDPAS